MNLINSLANEIEFRREQAQLSPRQLAFRLDISEASLSHRKHGRVEWSWSELEVLAGLFGISLSELIAAAESRQMAGAA